MRSGVTIGGLFHILQLIHQKTQESSQGQENLGEQWGDRAVSFYSDRAGVSSAKPPAGTSAKTTAGIKKSNHQP